MESGPEGYAQFLQAVRELFGITADLEMELTFDCAEPATGGWSWPASRMQRHTEPHVLLRDRRPADKVPITFAMCFRYSAYPVLLG